MLGKLFLCLLPLLLLLASVRIQAAIILSEAFAYPDGPLTTVSDGKWKTHSGTEGQVEVVAGAVQLSQKRSEDVHVPFPGGAIGTDTAPAVYASLKVTFSSLPTGSNGGYFAHFKDTAATTGMRCRIFATTNGAAPGTFRLGIAAGASKATAWSTQNLNLKTPCRLVCRMVLANNVSTLWVNPRSENDSSVSSTDEASPKTAAAFAFRESLASSNGIGELTVDDLVVATSFGELSQARPAAVVTEPADQTVTIGETTTFTVEAEGSEPLFFQWLCNGWELPGATNRVLVLTEVGWEHAGIYQVVVSNDWGSTASIEAMLTITPRSPVVSIAREKPVAIRLTWLAEPEQTYSIWAGDSVNTGFWPVAGDLFFPDGAGWFEEFGSELAARFYKVCSP